MTIGKARTQLFSRCDGTNVSSGASDGDVDGSAAASAIRSRCAASMARQVVKTCARRLLHMIVRIDERATVRLTDSEGSNVKLS